MNRLILAPLVLTGPAMAETPVVTHASVRVTDGTATVSVTLSHPDTGWDHYADGWEVRDAAGHVLGYRKLLHPHVAEQSFTRSLGNVIIPDGTGRIYIRAHCLVDGWSDQLFEIRLGR